MVEVQTSTNSRLRIAVMGAGNIGSAFAFQLARKGGHDVTAVARPGSARLAQLRRDNAIVNTNGDRAEVHVADSLNGQTPYDLVIVTLLANQVEAVLPALQQSRAKSVQFMFNTFEPERLHDAIGAGRCVFGMPFIQSKLDADGKLKATIGAMGQKSMMGRQSSVDVFNAAGLPAMLEPDMLLWLRCHTPIGAAFESACVAGVRRGGGASWYEAMALARGVHECFALIRGLGYHVYPRGKILIDRSPAAAFAGVLWALSRVRSFRELLATGENECRALVDAMLAAAPRANPAVDIGKIAAMKPSLNGGGAVPAITVASGESSLTSSAP